MTDAEHESEKRIGEPGPGGPGGRSADAESTGGGGGAGGGSLVGGPPGHGGAARRGAGNSGSGDGGRENAGGDRDALELSGEILMDHQREARQALALLQFAINSGKDVDDEVIEALNRSAITLMNGPVVTIGDCVAFEKAYRNLLDVTDPVTFLTLSASDANYGGREWGGTTASRWSTLLWALTIVLALYIVVQEGEELNLAKFSPLNEESSSALINRHENLAMRQMFLPYFYGALGALTYLLRRCHSLIHFRTFDPLRRGEYLNRILLGAVSGGMILLFIDPESLDLSKATRVTGVALAFLTGYNCDFLFTTLERIAAAILPKIGGEGKPPPSTSTSAVTAQFDVEKLVRMQEAATDPKEKEILRKLIEKLMRRD